MTAVSVKGPDNGSRTVELPDAIFAAKVNVPSVHVLTEDQLNTYDVLASDHVVFTEQALTAFISRAGSAKEAAK